MAKVGLLMNCRSGPLSRAVCGPCVRKKKPLPWVDLIVVADRAPNTPGSMIMVSTVAPVALESVCRLKSQYFSRPGARP